MSGPKPIQASKWFEPLRRLFQVQGLVQPQLIDDLIPTTDLLAPPIDLLWGLGWNRQFASSYAAAVAAQYTEVTFTNPANSARLVVLEGFWPLQAGQWEFVSDLTGPGGFSGLALDMRDSDRVNQLTGGVARVGQLSSAAAPFGPTVSPQLVLPVGFNPFPMVFFPGSPSLRLKWTTVNQAAGMGFQWREREFDPSELVR